MFVEERAHGLCITASQPRHQIFADHPRLSQSDMLLPQFFHSLTARARSAVHRKCETALPADRGLDILNAAGSKKGVGPVSPLVS